MADPTAGPADAGVAAFLDAVADDARRRDCHALLDLMRSASGHEPRMWGSIVGFGSYHYRYESGREGDSFLTGFAPRRNDLTIYVMSGLERYPALLAGLGKHRTGKSCLYVRRLSDIDLGVLRELVATSVRETREAHG
jgi:hypothetical protein